MRDMDTKMYISSLCAKGIPCGDVLGGRVVNNFKTSHEALESMKNAACMYLFAEIMKASRGHKNMSFRIFAADGTVLNGKTRQSLVCEIGYDEMVAKIKEGYGSPLFDTLSKMLQVEQRIKSLR